MEQGKIYLSHSRDMDYKSLYEELKKSCIYNSHNLILPHDKSDKPYDSKRELKWCDVLLADISVSSIGVGIEIGWADSYGVEIIIVYKKGTSVSKSLKKISDTYIEYNNYKDLINKLSEIL